MVPYNLHDLKLSFCHWSLSATSENIEKPGFLMFPGGIEREQRHEIS